MNLSAAAKLAVLLCAVIASACSFRDSWLIRSAFYPEVVESNAPGVQREGLDSVDDSAYGALLLRHVAEDGAVNYAALKADEAQLDRVLASYAAVEVSALSSEAELALLINAYNAFTLKLMLGYPQVRSIQDIPAARRWKDQRWQLAGRRWSLDAIEHQWIRAQHRQPLIHFGLVCASRGCPPLRREPYRARALRAQLQDQARRFFARESNLRWNAERQTLSVSELIDWFRDDFRGGGGPGAELRFVLGYAPPAIASEAQANIDSVRLAYLPYDWQLNGSWRQP